MVDMCQSDTTLPLIILGDTLDGRKNSPLLPPGLRMCGQMSVQMLFDSAPAWSTDVQEYTYGWLRGCAVKLESSPQGYEKVKMARTAMGGGAADMQYVLSIQFDWAKEVL